jgi:hypothetical protein
MQTKCIWEAYQGYKGILGGGGGRGEGAKIKQLSHHILWKKIV